MKTIFWNVDTQYDFMRPDGKLAIPGAEAIEPALDRLTRLAEQRGLQVVNTADWHVKGDAELADEPDFVNTFPEHCMQGTLGAMFVPATAPKGAYEIGWQDAGFDKEKLNNNLVLYKNRFDIFEGNPHADAVLQEINPDCAVVYGVATNVCVDFAVRGLRQRGIQVLVPTDAIKELPNLPLEQTLQAWQDAGARLIVAAEVKDYV